MLAKGTASSLCCLCPSAGLRFGPRKQRELPGDHLVLQFPFTHPVEPVHQRVRVSRRQLLDGLLPPWHHAFGLYLSCRG